MKIVEIEKSEAKYLALLKQKAEKIVNRRQQDVRDQNLEATYGWFFGLYKLKKRILITKYFFYLKKVITGNKRPLDPAHQRRLNEREERRWAYFIFTV